MTKLDPFDQKKNAGVVKPDAANSGGGAAVPALFQHFVPAAPDTKEDHKVTHPHTAQIRACAAYKSPNGNADTFEFYMPNNTPASLFKTHAQAAVEYHIGTPGIKILRVSIDY